MQANAQKKEQHDPGRLPQGRSRSIAQALGPILQDIMKQRGANLMLDKNALVYASPAAVKTFDITRRAIEQLNQKLPSLKVIAAPPPPRCPAKK